MKEGLWCREVGDGGGNKNVTREGIPSSECNKVYLSRVRAREDAGVERMVVVVIRLSVLHSSEGGVVWQQWRWFSMEGGVQQSCPSCVRGGGGGNSGWEHQTGGSGVKWEVVVANGRWWLQTGDGGDNGGWWWAKKRPPPCD